MDLGSEGTSETLTAVADFVCEMTDIIDKKRQDNIVLGQSYTTSLQPMSMHCARDASMHVL